MKATLQVELQPFQTPNFVRAVGQELPCYPLSELDSVTLEKLCDQFRAEVFQKAGKEQPPRQGCACSEAEALDRAVNRFLSWPLPRDFAPDGGITFNSGHVPHGSPLWPTGTNLLNESQAREMIKRVLGVVRAWAEES